MKAYILKKINWIFHFLAVTTVIVYAASSYNTFSANDDLCEVNFKKFHVDQESIYPSISLCFNAPFLEDRLKAYNSLINASEYEKFLLGRSDDLGRFSSIPYENVSLQDNDIFTDFERYYKTEISNSSKERNISIQSWAWFIGIMKCYTYNVPYEQGMLSSYINITFTNNVYPENKRPSDGWKKGGFHVFFHYPKHFSRSLTTNKRYWPTKTGSKKYSMRFYMKEMEVLRKRHKDTAECSDVVEYDDWLIDNITKTVNCFPPYWKNAGNVSICTNTYDLLRARKVFHDVFYVGSEYHPPCKEIRKLDIEYEDPDDVHDVPENHTQITVYFRNNFYKQIIQVRAYTLMSLVGNVGGFVGLLLGYALVQLPGLISIIHTYFNEKLHAYSSQKNEERNFEQQSPNKGNLDIIDTSEDYNTRTENKILA